LRTPGLEGLTVPAHEGLQACKEFRFLISTRWEIIEAALITCARGETSVSVWLNVFESHILPLLASARTFPTFQKSITFFPITHRH
jgi:hypothetical protein